MHPIVQKIVNWKFLLILVILAIIFGAYQILFAAGDPEAFKKGRMTIVYAIIGLALVLIADIIVDIVNEIVGY